MLAYFCLDLEMDTPYTALLAFIDNIIFDALGEMYKNGLNNQNDLTISAPQFLIDSFMRGVREENNFISDPAVREIMYMGIKFQPCYELEIAIWHKDYPLYREAWMLKKISLEPSRTIHQHPNYQKHMINIGPILDIYIKKNKVGLN